MFKCVMVKTSLCRFALSTSINLEPSISINFERSTYDTIICVHVLVVAAVGLKVGCQLTRLPRCGRPVSAGTMD